MEIQRLSCYSHFMAQLEPSIFEEIDTATEVHALEQAEADVAAGRVVSHEAVKRWLLSWGTSNELPRPKCGE
jgi:predicted transcriptional regulator